MTRERIFSGPDLVGLPWLTVSAFLRIVTNPRLQGERFTIAKAAQIIDGWVEQPNVRMLAPGEHHWQLFRQMIKEGQATGSLVSDAHLAALTLEFGGVLHSTDRDFARLPGLRWTNPFD